MASPNQPRHATLVFLSSAVASLGFVAAGCGSGPATPGVARVGTTTNQSSQSGGSSTGGSKAQVAARFSACMRSHGVRNFPDPSSGGGVTITSQSGIDPQSKRFQDAERACRKLLPAGNVSPAEQAQAQAQALKFSACMR